MSQRPIPVLLSFVVIVAASVGCAKPTTSTTSQSTPESVAHQQPADSKLADTPATSDAQSAIANSVELIEADWNQLQLLIGEQSGKVVVVDVWSTSCEPCMKEFPGLIKLQEKYPDDLVAISFDIDYAGIPKKPVAYYRERVLNYLNGQAKSKSLHRMSTTAADELLTQINLDSIPAIFVYGRDGKLAKQFQGVVSPNEELSYEKHVAPFVDQLVTDSRPASAGNSN